MPKKPAAAKQKKAAAKSEPKPDALAIPGTLYDGGNPIVDGKPRCGSKLRNKDRICMATALMANRRCRLHGGATPHGVASPNFKTGRFSKYLPNHLATRYTEHVNDPELVSNRDNLALVDVLINERLQQIYEGSIPDAWKVALSLLNEYEADLIAKEEFVPIYNREGIQVNHEPVPEDTRAQLKDHLRRGFRNASAFELLDPLLESHRKHVDTEYKRLKDLNTRLDVTEAVTIARLLVEAVKRHVRDPKTLTAIQADVSRVLSSRDS